MKFLSPGQKLTNKAIEKLGRYLSENNFLKALFRNNALFDKITDQKEIEWISSNLVFLKIPLPNDDYDYFINCFDNLTYAGIYFNGDEDIQADLSELEFLEVEGKYDEICKLLEECLYYEEEEKECKTEYLDLFIVDDCDSALNGRILYLINDQEREYIESIRINCQITKFEKNVLHYYTNLKQLAITIVDNYNLVIDFPVMESIIDLSLTKQIINFCEIVDLLSSLPNLERLKIFISLFEYNDLNLTCNELTMDLENDKVLQDSLSYKEKASKVMKDIGHLREIQLFSVSSLPVDIFILLTRNQNDLQRLDICSTLVESEQTIENYNKVDKWVDNEEISSLEHQISHLVIPRYTKYCFDFPEFNLDYFDDEYEIVEEINESGEIEGYTSIPMQGSFELDDVCTRENKSEDLIIEANQVSSRVDRSVSRSVFFFDQDRDGAEIAEDTSEYYEDESEEEEPKAVPDCRQEPLNFALSKPYVRFAVDDTRLLQSNPVKEKSILTGENTFLDNGSNSSNPVGGSRSIIFQNGGDRCEDPLKLLERSKSMYNLRYLMQNNIHQFEYRVKNVESETSHNLLSNTYTLSEIDELNENTLKVPFCKFSETDGAREIVEKLNTCISMKSLEKYKNESLKKLTRLFCDEEIEDEAYNYISEVLDCSCDLNYESKAIEFYIESYPEEFEHEHFSYGVFNDEKVTNYYKSLSKHTSMNEIEEDSEIPLDYKMQFYQEKLPQCMYGILLNNEDYECQENSKKQTSLEFEDEDKCLEYSLIVFILSLPKNIMKLDLKMVLFTQATLSILLENLSNLTELSIEELPRFNTINIEPSCSIRTLTLYDQGYLNGEELSAVFPSLISLVANNLILSDNSVEELNLQNLVIKNSYNLSAILLGNLLATCANSLLFLKIIRSPLPLCNVQFSKLRFLECQEILYAYEAKCQNDNFSLGHLFFLKIIELSPLLQVAEYNEWKQKYYGLYDITLADILAERFSNCYLLSIKVDKILEPIVDELVAKLQNLNEKFI